MATLQQQMDNNDKWLKLLLVLLILSLYLMITSCSCNYHLSKAEKKCGSHVQKDTIIVHDSFIVHSNIHDTLFKYSRDTVVMKQDRLTVKYFYNTKDSTVYLWGKCDTIKINRFIKVPYEKTVLETNWFDKFKWFIYIGGILVFLYFVIKLIK